MTTTDDLEFTNEEWVDRTIPEDTPVRARLEQIKLNVRPWTPKPGQRGYEVDPSTGQAKVQEIRKLEWWWEVIDDRDEGLYKGRKVKGECNPDMNSNPRNRLRAWSEALMNREIPIGGRLSLSDLTGLEALITVTHKDDKDDPTVKWERVDEVIPVTSFSDEPPF